MTSVGVAAAPAPLGFRFEMDASSRVNVVLTDRQGQTINTFAVRPAPTQFVTSSIDVRV